MGKRKPCGGLIPEMVSDFVPFGNIEDKDWSNPDCLRCQWHPENNKYSEHHPTKAGMPAYGYKDLSVCSMPGKICGKYSPPWKSEIVDKNLGFMENFIDSISGENNG